MLWHISQHWQHVEISVWYHCICADSVQSATMQEGKQSVVLVRKVCSHIYYDLEKKEKHQKRISDTVAIINTLTGSFVTKQTVFACLIFL